MRRYADGTYGEVHSLSCMECEEQDWGYKLVIGRDRAAVELPPLDTIAGLCPDCFEAFGDGWHNADEPATATGKERQ